MRSLAYTLALAWAGSSFGQCCESTYLVSDQTMSWQDARDFASAVGGHLVCLGSADEEAIVSQSVGPDREYWLGFTDEANEGNWRWITGEPVLYTRWQSGEPNNDEQSPTGEDYAMAWTFGGFGWWDYPSPYYGGNPSPVLAYAVAEFPSPPDPDQNDDGFVNGQDLALVLGFWGPCQSITCFGDANHNGTVDAEDLGIVLGGWTG